jgi:hypothetical protein
MEEVNLSQAERQKGLRCPHCHGRADGMTLISGEPGNCGIKPGRIGMCGYCGTPLVTVESFASYRAVSLRIATEAEVESFRRAGSWTGAVWKSLETLTQARKKTKGGIG